MIVTRVAGVSFRQADVKECEEGDTIALIPEPENPHDANAIKVLNTTHEPPLFIGYIPKDFTASIHQLIASDGIQKVTIESKGQAKNNGPWGVLLNIVEKSDPIPYDDNAPHETNEAPPGDDIMR